MPYANNNGVRIYYEVEGKGPPLLMLHGFSGSLDSMKRAGYVEALRDGYKLVLMDLLGHGNSDKPHSPEAYTVEEVCGDTKTVLDDLHISSANMMGYSAGGIFSLAFAIQARERVRSLILLDAGPHGSSVEQRRLIRQHFEGGPEAYVAMMEQSGPMPAAIKARMLANDFEALLAILDSPTQLVDLADELSGITAPCLVLLGENDAIYPHQKERELFSVVPDLTFKVLPGLDHTTGFIRSDMTLPYIKDFLARVN